MDPFLAAMAALSILGLALLLTMAPVVCSGGNRSVAVAMRMYCFYMVVYYTIFTVNLFKFSQLNMLVSDLYTQSTTVEWCDLAVPLAELSGAGVSSTQIVLMRQTLRQLSQKDTTTRLQTSISLGISVGIPIVLALLQYVTQGHRFNVVEGSGCSPPDEFTIPGVFVNFIWVLLLPLIGTLYAGE